jgi:pyruvate,water dikinase
MWLSSAFGLGADVVGGRAPADLFIVSRAPAGEVMERRLAPKETALASRTDAAGVARVPVPEAERAAPSLDDDAIRRLAELGLAAERHFGAPQDIEWAQDPGGRLWLLQSRPLVLGRRAVRRPPATDSPLKLRGRPLASGRGMGAVRLAHTLAEIDSTPAGAVLVVRQATPELARCLGRIAALIAEAGSSPQSHAAALLRQARVPAVCDAAGAFAALTDGDVVGVDGTRGEVYAGVPWPELRSRRRDAASRPPASGFVHDLVLRLTLVDASAASFRAASCASIHDIVRLVHERALTAMFELGDRSARGRGRATRRLESAIPLDLEVLDLGGGVAPGAPPGRRVGPDQIVSVPFRALWRGVVDPRVSWAGRRTVDAAGFFSVMQNTVMQELGAMRRLGDRNYLVVAPEYLNLNARLAYHYAMLDAVVGDAPDNNSISFRFAGGGAGRARRDLRGRFLAQVLGALGFGVDRRGDLVNAWLRAATRAASEEALAQLGRLMACARQLDMLLGDEGAVVERARSFLAGDYARFG